MTVSLGDDAEIISVLNAIEGYVTARAQSAWISLDGRKYVMHPDPAA